jgi:hypothetical protein
MGPDQKTIGPLIQIKGTGTQQQKPHVVPLPFENNVKEI